jgi:hypothetical protein
LRRLLGDAVESGGTVDSDQVVEVIAGLRDSGQGCLVSRDWAEFEHFSDEIVAANGRADLRAVLGKFEKFIEGLMQDVQIRTAR